MDHTKESNLAIIFLIFEIKIIGDRTYQQYDLLSRLLSVLGSLIKGCACSTERDPYYIHRNIPNNFSLLYKITSKKRLDSCLNHDRYPNFWPHVIIPIFDFQSFVK